LFNRPSEFEVQALAYWNLKQIYPKIRGEYKIKKDIEKGLRGARFDIVIFDSLGDMKLIIEVKKTSYQGRIKQGCRYTELTGIPCIYIRGMTNAKNAVDIVNKYLVENNIIID
jgi:hypothetical protein